LVALGATLERRGSGVLIRCSTPVSDTEKALSQSTRPDGLRRIGGLASPGQLLNGTLVFRGNQESDHAVSYVGVPRAGLENAPTLAPSRGRVDSVRRPKELDQQRCVEAMLPLRGSKVLDGLGEAALVARRSRQSDERGHLRGIGGRTLCPQ
jgi:hypothetical protein